MGRTPKRVVKLRRDPADIFKQFGVTFTGLVVVTITMVGIIVTHGDAIDSELQDAGTADVASAHQDSASHSVGQEASAGPQEVPESGQVNLTDVPELT